MSEEKFPLSLKREDWTPPALHFEFLWVDVGKLFKQVEATFRINKKLELCAVGDQIYKDGDMRMLTLVFREVQKPKAGRRAFSLKKEWELTDEGEQTLDTIKAEAPTK